MTDVQITAVETTNVEVTNVQATNVNLQGASALAKRAALLLGLLVFAIVLPVPLGYVAMEALPCDWFGSAHEGACGFGAFNFVLTAGWLGSIAIYLGLLWPSFNQMSKTADAVALCLHWLRATFGLVVLCLLLQATGWVPRQINELLLQPLGAGFCLAVFVAARQVHRHPWVWALATCFAWKAISHFLMPISPFFPLAVLLASSAPPAGAFVYLERQLKSATRISAT